MIVVDNIVDKVSDYMRDLEEMQNVSREDYLASLRRKSSGFSRGVAKYRGLSSRWDPSGGRLPGPSYFNSIDYGIGEDSAAGSEYASGFGIDKKIDLTSYIKWWGSSRVRTSDSLSKCTEETKPGHLDDIESELKPLERAIYATEPYQMPRLGIIHEGEKRESKLSAMSILSQSAAFKSLQDKALKKQEKQSENDENEDKIAVGKMEYGKAVEKLHEGLGVSLGGTGTLHLQRSMYPLSHILSAPLLTNYNTIDHVADPILWTTHVPVLPSGLPHTAGVTKTEISSNYTTFQRKE